MNNYFRCCDSCNLYYKYIFTCLFMLFCSDDVTEIGSCDVMVSMVTIFPGDDVEEVMMLPEYIDDVINIFLLYMICFLVFVLQYILLYLIFH